MHLQTTLIIPNHNLQLKNNSRSHLLNFLHPLHILKKTNTQNIQQNNISLTTQQPIKNLQPQQNNYLINTKKNLVTFQKKIDNFVPTQRKLQKKHTNFLDDFRQNIRNTQNPCENNKITKLKPQNLANIEKKNDDSSFFNEDDGILQHLIKKFQFQTNNLSSFSKNDFKTTIKNENFQNKEAKCFIIFGFSVSLIEIQQFLSLHPEINLTIKLYKYDDNQFYKQTQISQEDDLQIEEKIMKLSKMLNGQNILNCEEITFVFQLWKKGDKPIRRQNYYNNEQNSQRVEMGEIYFFPSINTQNKPQQNNWIQSRVIERESSAYSQKVHFNSFNEPSPSVSYDKNMGSLRKSHQNFRILQVLQYYLSLECHSEHIMISPSESLLIRRFLKSIYEKQLQYFYIFIDHQSKQSQAQSKINHDPTQRSIMPLQKQDHTHHLSPSNTSNYLLSYTEPQFITVNGQLIMNDQFLSKLSSIKPPQPCIDSLQFRKQKQQMYHMKLQQYQEEKQLRKVKKEFTQMINYLNSLIGLEKVSYEQISLESLKTIKNAKIRQSTLELKQLVNLSHEKEIRYQDLKSKIALYEKTKTQNHQLHDNKLSSLRKQIIDLQKQLNLHKNQISNIYQMSSQELLLSQSNVSLLQNPNNQRTSIEQSKPVINSPYKEFNQSKVQKQLQKNNSTLKSKISTLQQNNFINPQTRLSTNQSNTLLSPKNQPKPNSPVAPRSSLLKPQVSSQRGGSFLANRNSSQQFLNKYAPILEQLRKQKYQQQLQQQRTRCQFQAEKQFQKLKQQYKKATKDLLLILGDCD